MPTTTTDVSQDPCLRCKASIMTVMILLYGGMVKELIFCTSEISYATRLIDPTGDFSNTLASVAGNKEDGDTIVVCGILIISVPCAHVTFFTQIDPLGTFGLKLPVGPVQT